SAIGERGGKDRRLLGGEQQAAVGIIQKSAEPFDDEAEVRPSVMPQAHPRGAPEQGKSDLLNHPIPGPSLIPFRTGQTEYAPPLIERQLPSGRLVMGGNGAAPVGMIAIRLGPPLHQRADLGDELVSVGVYGSACRRDFVGVEYHRILGVLT